MNTTQTSTKYWDTTTTGTGPSNSGHDINVQINREEYERNLKRIQEEHLKKVADYNDNIYWQPCLHDSCMECHGTGVKLNGSMCIHYISCSCPKCSPRCVC